MSFSSPQQQQLGDIAKLQTGNAMQEANFGEQLQSWINSGTLPPNAQALVNQNLAAENAATRTGFANLGLSDSTMATSALNQNKQASQAQTFTIEEQLAQLGQAAVNSAFGGLQGAEGTYQNIAGNIVSQDNALMAAIGNFGKALGGAAALGGAGGLFGGGAAGAAGAAGGSELATDAAFAALAV